jgi:predicted GIY-YIG superfamily endonuclease
MSANQQLFRLYILRCADGVLFATMSDEPPSACVAEYNAGHGQPFTKGRRPVSLAFACDVSTDRHDAMGVVWVVRQSSRSAKERLCNGCPILIRKVLKRGKGLGARLRRHHGQ